MNINIDKYKKDTKGSAIPNTGAEVKIFNHTGIELFMFRYKKENGKYFRSPLEPINFGIDPSKASTPHIGSPDHMFVVFTKATGSIFCITNFLDKEYHFTSKDIIFTPNEIGSPPKQSEYCVIPPDSPKYVVGLGKLPNGKIAIREQYWAKSGNSYSIVEGEQKEITSTITSGRQSTSSSESELSTSVTGTASSSWGAVSASVAASLNYSKNTSDSLSVTDEVTTQTTRVLSYNKKIDGYRGSQIYFYWNVVDMITIIDHTNNGLPAANVTNVLEPAIASVYNVKRDDLKPITLAPIEISYKPTFKDESNNFDSKSKEKVGHFETYEIEFGFRNSTIINLIIIYENKELYFPAGSVITASQLIIRQIIGGSAQTTAIGDRKIIVLNPSSRSIFFEGYFNNEAIGKTKSYIVDINSSVMAKPNFIGRIPCATSDALVPRDSPRYVVGCGKLPNKNTVIREQYWARSPASYSFAPGEEREISFRHVSGTQSSSSTEKQISDNVSVSGSYSFGAVSASISASLSYNTTDTHSISVTDEVESFNRSIIDNGSEVVKSVFVWQLVDVYTIYGNDYEPLASFSQTQIPPISIIAE